MPNSETYLTGRCIRSICALFRMPQVNWHIKQQLCAYEWNMSLTTHEYSNHKLSLATVTRIGLSLGSISLIV